MFVWASVCVCDCLTEGWKGVARKYQEEQLDFYERNWISSRHIIIGEHFMGADPRRTKKAAQYGRGTQTESGKQRERQSGYTQEEPSYDLMPPVNNLNK